MLMLSVVLEKLGVAINATVYPGDLLQAAE